jgi:protein gp37
MAHDIEYWEHHHQSWMEKSWQPITGCIKISMGCTHCYAERIAAMLARTQGCVPIDRPFQLVIHDGRNHDLRRNTDRFDRQWESHPARRRKPTRYFVLDMGDIFLESIEFGLIQRVFTDMAEINQHLYLVLTKRAERMAELAPELPWPDNVVAAVTVEHADYINRIDCLRQVPATTRMIMAEPLLGPLPDLDLSGIHQMVVGGESGHGARPMDPEWVRGLRDQCVNAEVAFFFKQWGGPSRRHRDQNGCVLDGEVWRQWPERIKEWHRNRGVEYVIRQKHQPTRYIEQDDND